MPAEETNQTETGPRKSDKYIPWYFVAFFAVFLSFDAVFYYMASTSHTGVVVENSYQHGLDYNDVVSAAETQTALGWQSEITFTNTGQLELQLNNTGGDPVTAATVTARFFRPTQAGGDFTIALNDTGSGLYRSDQINAAPGQWEIRVYVLWKQQHYQVNKRVLVPK